MGKCMHSTLAACSDAQHVSNKNARLTWHNAQLPVKATSSQPCPPS